MAGEYEIWLTNDYGVRLASLDGFIKLNATRKVGRIGALELQLNPRFDEALITKPDRMVQVWRAPAGGRLGLWRVYLVRYWKFSTKGADELLLVKGVDMLDLLRRRVVAYYAGEDESGITDQADDMMKTVVTGSIADGTAPAPDAGTRVWADLSVAGNLTDGPSITKAFSWKQLLQRSGAGVLPDIAKAAREAGTEVFFDVAVKTVSSTDVAFEFQTTTGQPGMDVSDRVVFDQERGNLQDPFLEYDYREEVNYVYGGGQGTEAEREIQQEYDEDRYNTSQWNRCEAFADARNQTEADGVREAARARLEEGRPVRRFGGVPMDTAGSRFGRDWDYGDKVRARYRGQEFDAIVRSVVLSMKDGVEVVQARLEYED